MSEKLSVMDEYKVPKGIVDLNQVSGMLMEMMREVKGNPAAIPQAECMVEIAGRVVDIAVAQTKQGMMVVELVKLKQNND